MIKDAVNIITLTSRAMIFTEKLTEHQQKERGVYNGCI